MDAFRFGTSKIKTTSLVVQWTSQCEGHGFDPWSGKIPHVVEQLKLVRHNC